MITPSGVPSSIDGAEVANEFLHEVYAGLVPIQDARLWIAELRREGLAQLAAEISVRLPTFH